jgi:hypothetical protein
MATQNWAKTSIKKNSVVAKPPTPPSKPTKKGIKANDPGVLQQAGQNFRDNLDLVNRSVVQPLQNNFNNNMQLVEQQRQKNAQAVYDYQLSNMHSREALLSPILGQDWMNLPAKVGQQPKTTWQDNQQPSTLFGSGYPLEKAGWMDDPKNPKKTPKVNELSKVPKMGLPLQPDELPLPDVGGGGTYDPYGYGYDYGSGGGGYNSAQNRYAWMSKLINWGANRS